uniref:Uncharacterized protein n=1 Tax=Lepeophtheirus salmonis TaxID=72036 RepID=A0A0K2V1D0_LEPSM
MSMKNKMYFLFFCRSRLKPHIFLLTLSRASHLVIRSIEDSGTSSHNLHELSSGKPIFFRCFCMEI